ncbi:hypothetical protein [Compostimonas suwonensis]|uniref:Uncharacterized protein n=1 Tax=Compostimonas suwonensis TaxID=1048394 RepID=A0A2M9BUL5_9MICO|nr:hypothetical protein [Compostimonas suwonensis]PJJ61646.1 hypothetical protein CLV54_2594 [Compostimonas suwonensis]
MSTRSNPRANPRMSSRVSQSGIEENTLGVVVGREERRRRRRRRDNREFRRPRRTIQATRVQDGLGSVHLGVGIGIAAGAIMLLNLSRFLGYFTLYPDPSLAVAAWAIFVGTVVATAIIVRVNGYRLPTWMFAVLLSGLALSLALDLMAVWGSEDLGIYPTAGVAVGAALMAIVTLRETREILIATGALCVTLALSMVTESRDDLLSLAPELVVLALAIAPPIAATSVLRAFRRMVQLEVDRVLVQSTVSTPHLAVGMLASEELARLDLAAERLLDDVANGKHPFPLPPAVASNAATLATELRLHLIDGRRKSWLFHAITESEFLGPVVTLSDPDSLAGLMDPEQRDGLLSAIWLLLSDAAAANQKIRLTLGPPVPSMGRPRMFPVVILTTGVPRHRVDPSTWEAIKKVGRYVDSNAQSSVRIDIQCSVIRTTDH